MNGGGGHPPESPDLVVTGGDGDLASWVAERPGALVEFRPADASDVARMVGLRAGTGPRLGSVALDALRLGDGTFGVNMVVLGVPPDRLGRFSRRASVTVEVDGRRWFDALATTVVVATGEYLRGFDLVPRGHPGDGRAEVQVYRVRPAERRPLRRRLPAGAHVPHPRILQRSGRHFEIRSDRPLRVEVDGVTRPAIATLSVEVVAGAYRLAL